MKKGSCGQDPDEGGQEKDQQWTVAKRAGKKGVTLDLQGKNSDSLRLGG